MKLLFSILISVVLGTFSAKSQVPHVAVQYMDYEDYQNENLENTVGIKKITSKTGRLSDEWSWNVTVKELDEAGRIVVIQSGVLSADVVMFGDPTVFEYHENGMWKSMLNRTQMITREFIYNDKNELIEIRKSDGTLRKYYYDLKSRIVRAEFSDKYWNTYSYNDSLNQIENIKVFRDSILFEQKVYSYQENSYEIEIANFYDFAPEDTFSRYEYFFYDKDTNLICTESKESYSDGWESLITNFRYKNDNLVESTNYLSVQKTSGYTDYYYNSNGKLERVQNFVKNGKSLTREVKFTYEYY
ncbi:hypothetical protein DNU06_10560 [Putridiphycobacter roseus]|uniref:YD repeat-containing protein n=1 Tax=Putridiphycobacter roseus TaxID=2219161 RepID=A0A2W1NPZ9_9FLAO|nr:hypothetical protein [Putridiphycobacter roseus]PZE16698.1 hypothetical protein DNU06_10560 [Putridiphycobacter roseus]